MSVVQKATAIMLEISQKHNDICQYPVICLQNALHDFSERDTPDLSL